MVQTELNRALGFRECLAIVVGTIIGTGIFLKTAIMAQTVGSPIMVLAAWIIAGLLSLAGALTYAELGSLFPKAGGEFVYLREAYGELPAFLFGWMRFWIGSPGSIAAYGVGSATFLSALLGWNQVTHSLVALAFVLTFTLINCLTVQWGGRVQVFMTALKAVMIALLVFGLFGYSHGSFSNLATPLDWQWRGWSVLGTALIAALWAYDGWNNLPMASGEVKQPQKNVPRALIIGTVAIVVIYGLTNLAYFYALPFAEILTANSPHNRLSLPVATKAAQTFLGAKSILFLSIAFVVSALGAMNGSILSGARVPFAMAREKLFFKRLAFLHPQTKTPVTALLVQGIWACILALSGSFDQLTDYVIFSVWIFYALCAGSVFVFRKKFADRPREYKVPWYPILPLVFIAVSAWLLINTLISSPRESGVGLMIIGAGIPVYFLVFRKKRPTQTSGPIS